MSFLGDMWRSVEDGWAGMTHPGTIGNKQTEYNKAMWQSKFNSLINGGLNYHDKTGMNNNLASVIANQLRGNNLGMSQEEMQTYMSGIKNSLNEQRAQGVQSTMQSMNQRGILGSDITAQGLNQIDKNYAKSLSDAQNNMYLQNEAMKRQGLQNAINTAMGLDQTNYNRWLTSQTLPIQLQMQYMQGIELPQQQMNAQYSQANGQLLGQVLAMLMKGGMGL